MKPLAQPAAGASLLPKACILVAGMHRSGTSAAARIINLLGADIARELTPAIAGNNDRGFWEPRAVLAIHDRLLAALGSAWDDPFALPGGWTETDAAADAKRALADEIAKDFLGSSVCVVKDPRLGRLLPLWLELLDELEIEPIVVVSVRNPLEVAASLRQRDRFPLGKSLLMYLRHALETELASRGRRRLFVRYDHLLVDWRSFARKLERMLGSRLLALLPGRDDAIDRFLTLDLYRNRATHETLGTAPDIPSTIVELFDRMSEAADTGDETALRQACDRMRATLEGGSQLFQLFLPHASADADEGVPFPPIPRSAADFVSSASFWFPEHLCGSAWIEHAPFAFWLIEAHRPSTMVELGTDRGFSFFAFCQAVHALGLGTRCFAVDTWGGDDHAGRDGEAVFAAAREYNDNRYAAFARLVRATSAEAAALFADGSIDLLHVDGRHRYEDVRRDFDLWLCKLSRRGVVVFHDTAVHEHGSGVHRLWVEVRERYPSFEFLHGRGLGISATGEEIGARLRTLFEASSDEGLGQQIRSAYARLGAAVSERLACLDQRRALAIKDADLAAHGAELARLTRDVAADRSELARVNHELAAERNELARVNHALAAERSAVARMSHELAAEQSAVARLTAASVAQKGELDAQKGELDAQKAELDAQKAELDAQKAELEAMKRSTSWRITHLLRRSVDAMRRR
jgi:hypothetical protein